MVTKKRPKDDPRGACGVVLCGVASYLPGIVSKLGKRIEGKRIAREVPQICSWVNSFHAKLERGNPHVWHGIRRFCKLLNPLWFFTQS